MPTKLIKSFRDRLKSIVLYQIASSNRKKRPTGVRSALVCPSASPGSIGDAAMMKSIRVNLEKHGFTKIDVIEQKSMPQWRDFERFGDGVEMPVITLTSWSKFARDLQNYTHFFTIGADCIDGHYSPPLSLRLINTTNFATHAGCVATICGSSFNDNEQPDVAKTLKKLHPSTNIFARDPESHERLKSATSANTELVADLAFLLEPDKNLTIATQEWITSKKAANKRILGVNIASISLGKKNRHLAPKLIENFVGAISHTIETHPNISVVLVPHDARGQNSDVNLCKLIHEKLHSDHKGDVLLYQESLDPSALKSLAGMLNVCITCRMHFGIACLGSGIPIGALTYQAKFDGLFKIFEIEAPAINGKEALKKENVIKLFEKTLASAELNQEIVKSKVDTIKSMAKLNFTLVVDKHP